MRSKDQKRNLNVDLIRCVAVFFVIAVHFFMNVNYYGEIMTGKRMYIMTLVRVLCMICVPLFMLLTGYLMNKKKLSKSYYKAIGRVLLLYLICSIACLVFKIYYLDYPLTLKTAILGIFDYTGAQYGWYIEMYIGLFLLIPFVNLIWNGLENKRHKQWLILTFILLTLLPSVFNIFDWIAKDFFLNPWISNVYQKIWPSWWVTLYPLTYYFIGAYIKEYDIKLSIENNICLFLIAIFALGTFNFFRNYGTVFDCGIYAEWYSFENTVTSVLAFLLVLHLDLSKLPKFLEKIIIKVSDLSLGTYLISFIPDQLIYPKVLALAGSVLLSYSYYVPTVLAVFISSNILSFIIDLFMKFIMYVYDKVKNFCVVRFRGVFMSLKDWANKFWRFVKENKYYVLLFCFMLIIFAIVPISGDDLGNYNQNTSISWSFANAIHSYMTYESRIASRFLINILCYHKWLWAILNAGALTVIYWALAKLVNIKEDKGYLLLLICLLLIPCAMFGQVYVWVTGSITYLFPAALILGYFAYLFKVKKEFNKKNLIIFSLINFIAPMFIDHCGAALVIGNILYLIKYYIENKKISLNLSVWTLFSIASLFVVFFAPGNNMRLQTTTEFMELSFLGKCFFNWTKLIDYLYYANPLFIILSLVVIIYFINKVIRKNVIIRYLLIGLLCLIPLYSVFYGGYMYNPFIEFTYSLDFYWPTKTFLNSILVYVFWIGYSILFVGSIIYIVKDKKELIEYLLILFIGLSPNFAMLLSPTWGFRTMYFSSVVVMAISAGLIAKILKNEKYKGSDVPILLKTGTVVLLVYLFANFVFIHHFEIVRLENVVNQYESGSRDIVIKSCPSRYMWNYNPHMEFHSDNYKRYLRENDIIGEDDINLHFVTFENPFDMIRGW